jgi:endonuclease YncB( thermonuclease family)
LSFLPFILLAASLLLFLLSTRQFSLFVRTAIWIGGAAVLALSAAAALGGPKSAGVLQALIDFLFRSQGGEILLTALAGNFATVGGAVAPMFGVFVVLAAIVAALSLIAFTPGQAIEKLVRPLNIALIGAMAGGLIALGVAGLGLGGLEKRRVYINVVSAADVIDGDTIRMGDISLRLWGIDAPEDHTGQVCRRSDGGLTPYTCGVEATKVLEGLVANKLVICEAPQSGDESGGGAQAPPPTESFGRPVMACWTAASGERLYLSAEMARLGYADVDFDNRWHPSKAQILAALAEARAGQIGMWKGWHVSPDNWRNNKPCRDWFASGGWRPAPGNDPIVACPPVFIAPPANDNPPPAPPPQARAAPI